MREWELSRQEPPRKNDFFFPINLQFHCCPFFQLLSSMDFFQLEDLAYAKYRGQGCSVGIGTFLGLAGTGVLLYKGQQLSCGQELCIFNQRYLSHTINAKLLSLPELADRLTLSLNTLQHQHLLKKTQNKT